MIEEVQRLIGKAEPALEVAERLMEEIIKPVAFLKIADGRAFLTTIKDFLNATGN